MKGMVRRTTQPSASKGNQYWRHRAERSGHAVHRITDVRTDASVRNLRTLRS